VTGGAGFIGSHLCELLLEDGWEVFWLDDLSTGSADNIRALDADPCFHLVVDSVLAPAVVNELVYKCNVVYHLAAAVGVPPDPGAALLEPRHECRGHRSRNRPLRPFRQTRPRRLELGGIR
jgi:nucleoside-diphosphate-sugar epimerase